LARTRAIMARGRRLVRHQIDIAEWADVLLRPCLPGTGLVEHFEHRFTNVVVDERGAHVGRLWAFGETVDHEVVEMLRVADSEMDQEVVIP